MVATAGAHTTNRANRLGKTEMSPGCRLFDLIFEWPVLPARKDRHLDSQPAITCRSPS